MINLAHSKLAFIGFGKMAEALLNGLLKQRNLPHQNIIAADKQAARRRILDSCYKVKAFSDNSSAVAFANIIILAVKPQDLKDVLEEISPFVTKSQLVISIAAGFTLESLQMKLKKVPLIRAMPNNPAMAGCGVTALSAGNFATEAHLKLAEEIFRQVGETFFVPEKYMDAVTALSGSGPAFVYLFLEGLLAGAKRINLPQPTARRLALRTIEGAVRTVERTALPPARLRKMVTSKKGTTEAGLKVLNKYKFKKAIEETLFASAKRSKELSL